MIVNLITQVILPYVCIQYIQMFFDILFPNPIVDQIYVCFFSFLLVTFRNQLHYFFSISFVDVLSILTYYFLLIMYNTYSYFL